MAKPHGEIVSNYLRLCNIPGPKSYTPKAVNTAINNILEVLRATGKQPDCRNTLQAYIKRKMEIDGRSGVNFVHVTISRKADSTAKLMTTHNSLSLTETYDTSRISHRKFLRNPKEPAFKPFITKY